MSVTAIIWNDGDASVGIPGDYLELINAVEQFEDKTHREAVRETLREFFSDYCEFPVQVRFSDEIEDGE